MILKNGKKDGILVLIVCVIALLGCGYYYVAGKEVAREVVIRVDGQVYGRYSLEEDIEVLIGETNCLSIQNGIVSMSEAKCRDQICVNHKPISKNGESIICLPNKVVVEVTSDETMELDVIAN